MRIDIRNAFVFHARKRYSGLKTLLRNPATLIWTGIVLSLVLLVWAAVLSIHTGTDRPCHDDEVEVPGGGCVLKNYDFADVPPCESGRGEHDVRECLDKI